MIYKTLSKLLVSEIMSNGSYYTALSSDTNNQYHCHEFIEIFYVVAGSATHVLNERKQLISVGDCFFIKPTDYHQFLPSEKSSSFLHRDICVTVEEFKKICEFVSCSAESDFLNVNSTPHCKLSTDDIAFYENYFKPISLDYYTDFVNRICKTVSSMLLTAMLNNETRLNSSAMPDWIRQIVDYAKSPFFYTSTINPINHLTENLSFSKQHVCNMFKKYVGTSISEYYLQQKLNYAKHLIMSTSDPISNISYESGFNNESFFYRSFKKHFGITPLDMRKKVKK